jgi:amino acid transporter
MSSEKVGKEIQSQYRLAKVLGVVAVVASAAAQEYGAGINYVAVNSLSVYPAMTSLVPLAMFVAGILLIPKTYLYARFSRVVSKSGATYVWTSRTLHPLIGFIVIFGWWVGVTAAMGFLAFTVGTTSAQLLVALGIKSGAWLSTRLGHLAIGLAVIWLIFSLHYSGIRNYGYFVIAMLALILITASTVMIYGFTTPSSLFISAASNVIHSTPTQPSVPPLTFNSFFGTVTLFMFAYGGISAATLLGGETRNPNRDVPRGIVYGWLVALILFTLVALAVFSVAPWWVVIDLIKSKASFYATVPGIITLVAPPAVGAFVTIVTTVILAKTIAPEMMESSRLLFSWSQDSILPSIFTHVNRFRAPDAALIASAILGSLFLAEATLIGWSIGVVIRSVTLVIAFMFVGLGAIREAFKRGPNKADWEKWVSSKSSVAAGVAAVIVGLILIPTVLVSKGAFIAFQPWFQLLVTVIVGALFYAISSYRMRKSGINLTKEILERIPLE